MAERELSGGGESGKGALFPWSETPPFRLFEAAEWRYLAALTRCIEVAAGEILWREGESGGQLYCICRGRLEAVRRTPEWGKPIIVAGFAPGSVAGSLPAAGDEAHSTTLVVVVDAELLLLERSGLEELERNRPELAAKFWRGWAQLELSRLRQANRRLVTLF